MEAAKEEIKPKMKCCNCGESTWRDVDGHRIKPAGMCMCTGCGFISYPKKWKTPEEIKKYYRADYRNPPTHQNCFAGERKNHYHHKFLLETFERWKAEGLENPKIGEVGAAFGFTLNWIRSIFPKAEIYGTELTSSFRRNAYHEFGIVLTEDFDESIKYDLILSYKVLEHQLDPHLELEKYQRCLNDKGQLYISVPTWFNSIYNFGLSGFDPEYYYDPNHINVWTIAMFENILQRAGFEITKSDQIIYSSTYLVKPNDAMKNIPVFKHNTADVLTNLERVKAAYLALTENQYEKAIALWPDYPQAWASHAENVRKQLTEKGWDWFKAEILDKAMAACPTSSEVVGMATDFAMRAHKWDQAIEWAEKNLKMRPENAVAYHQLANTLREVAIKSKDANERLHYFLQAREVCRHLRNVSAQHMKEATDLIYLFNSKIPFKGEKELVTGKAKPQQSVLQLAPEASL